MPALTIAELRDEEELQLCVALLRAAFGTVAKEFDLTEVSAPTNAAFTTIENLCKHLLNGMTLYGMCVASKLVGCVGVKKSKADSLVFYIERLGVAPEQRHRGHGDTLLAFAIEQIKGKRPRNRLLLCGWPEGLGIDILRKQGGKLFGSPG